MQFCIFFARFTAVLSVQYYHLNMLNVLWTEHRKEDDFCSKIIILCFQLGLSDQPQNVKIHYAWYVSNDFLYMRNIFSWLLCTVYTGFFLFWFMFCCFVFLFLFLFVFWGEYKTFVVLLQKPKHFEWAITANLLKDFTWIKPCLDSTFWNLLWLKNETKLYLDGTCWVPRVT